MKHVCCKLNIKKREFLFLFIGKTIIFSVQYYRHLDMGAWNVWVFEKLTYLLSPTKQDTMQVSSVYCVHIHEKVSELFELPGLYITVGSILNWKPFSILSCLNSLGWMGFLPLSTWNHCYKRKHWHGIVNYNPLTYMI